MRRTGLPARDLRVLDPLLSYPSSILGRELAVVINLEHVKAIVTAKEVFDALFYQPSGCSVRSGFAASHFFSSSFVHTTGDTPETSVVAGPKVLAFEFRALESCLESACGCLDSEFKKSTWLLLTLCGLAKSPLKQGS
ncbi:hypothetical protein CUMW_187910 [Citrus unshiu]|nr:hypothetical protein CUMW_187910 [Citrus unshiu]